MLDDIIADLAASFGMTDDDLMAMISVYFDDSGTHLESEIAIAACLVSDVRRWNLFEQRCETILVDYGLAACGFHMTDFVARVRPYHAWSNGKCEQLLMALVKEINNNILAGMATAVIKMDYDRLVVGRLREKLGNYHYTFAVESCLAYIEAWRRNSYTSQPMEYIFDKMGKGKHEIINLFDDIANRSSALSFGIEPQGYAFQDRKRTIPLQAADILAWEANKYMREHQFTGKAPRRSFKSLVDGVGVRARFFDASNLPELIADMTDKYNTVGWDGPLGGFMP